MVRDALGLDAAEAQVCAVLRGSWPDPMDAPAARAFLAAAVRHRVRPLLAWHLRRHGDLASCAEPTRAALVGAERAEAAIEAVRRLELCRLLPAFGAAGIDVMLFKGAALAFSHYPEPWLRPREDTDLLVRQADLERVGLILAAAGVLPFRMVQGELVTHQRTYVREDRAGFRHEWDVHWKIANPVAFADLLTFDELLQQSALVQIDGTAVRVPRSVHALAIACLHRVSHHHDSADLLWLYDIHLLVERLTGAEAADLAAIARRCGIAGICARGVRLAHERFDTRLPSSLLANLDEAATDNASLPAAYLGAQVSKVNLLMADLAAIHGWRRKLQLIREHLFPPAEYVLARYGRSRFLLPFLYLWRIVAGARGWFRPLD